SAARFAGWLESALRGLVEALGHAPQRAVAALPVLPEAEMRELVGSAAIPAPVGDEDLVHRRFERLAASRPEAVALSFGDEHVSYGELNARANRLAHRLIALGVRPDDRVALCLERGVDLVVGLLGILKAGAGYVPLDPAYPAERLAFTLADCAPVAV